MATYALAIAVPLIAMAIGFYLYCTALSKTIKGSLFFINRNAQAEKSDQATALQQIVEFLELHSSAKQLSKRCIKFGFVRSCFDFLSFPGWSSTFPMYFNFLLP